MKKRIVCIVLAVLLAAVLFVPIPQGPYEDGGTRAYTALTYKVVQWNRITDYGNYNKTELYWLPHNFKSVDALWEQRAGTPEDQPSVPDREPYTGQWLDKTTAVPYESGRIENIVITEIYADCFFATYAIPSPTVIKLNGAISEQWCVGDQVSCTVQNGMGEAQGRRLEVDMVSIEVSRWMPEPGKAYKPVIYLYPRVETEVSVKLRLDGTLTCTYPSYDDGWCVTALPDGTLTDAGGQTYNYLYWEGTTQGKWDMQKGFCVKGEDTAAFLEEALARLGMVRREANEFIVYWLPLMEGNPYNIISFQTEAYTDAAALEVTPRPDTVIRVFMTWQASESYVNLEPQMLTAPEREGFTLVEWGGTEVK